MMSKPISRVTLIAVVGLVLVLAAYLTVQAVFAKSDSAGVQSHLVGGLQTNFNHDRSSAGELETFKTQPGMQSPHGSGGGCEHESGINPSDF